jgi:ribosome biogenesis GTPase
MSRAAFHVSPFTCYPARNPMSQRRGKPDKDPTSLYRQGGMDDDAEQTEERFSARSGDKAQQRKMEKTALLRAAEAALEINPETLPQGQVTQVYSLYSDVESEGKNYLCVVRKTLAKLSASAIVVGDYVRFRPIGSEDEKGRPEAVIEAVLPRTTVLTRSDSFKAMEQHPIVANAQQMLIVVSLHEPDVRWGLVDRMLVAAQAGGLRPIVCLNKIDLNKPEDPDGILAQEILTHYAGLGIGTLQTSIMTNQGIEDLRATLLNKTTVLAGHSGVGKSSLIHCVEPEITVRIGAISGYTGKGRHTTTSARRYALPHGGQVIDTPGVKLFGLWNVTRETLPEYFPDLQTPNPPQWRMESYKRILDSLPEPNPGTSRT